MHNTISIPGIFPQGFCVPDHSRPEARYGKLKPKIYGYGALDVT